MDRTDSLVTCELCQTPGCNQCVSRCHLCHKPMLWPVHVDPSSHDCPVLAERMKASEELQRMQSIIQDMHIQLVQSQQDGMKLAHALESGGRDIQRGKMQADAITAQAQQEVQRASDARNADRHYADEYVHNMRAEIDEI